MPRTHFFTGRGSLCGTLAVISWVEVHREVTCPQCRALLPLSAAERQHAVFGRVVGIARDPDHDDAGK